MQVGKSRERILERANKEELVSEVTETIFRLQRFIEQLLPSLEIIKKQHGEYPVGIKDAFNQLHEIVYTYAHMVGSDMLTEISYEEGMEMTKGVMRVTEVQHYIPTVFGCVIGEDTIAEITDLLKEKARGGDLNAITYMLDRVYINEKRKTFTKGLNFKNVNSQKDVDKAMTKVIHYVTHEDPTQRISLEEAEMIASLLKVKKDTLDECLEGEVIEIKKHLGIE